MPGVGVLPSFIESSITPWLADKADEWPVIPIETKVFEAARKKAGPDKQALLDRIGQAAWAIYLGGSLSSRLGLWESAVRATKDPDGGIRWENGDALRQVICGAVVFKDDGLKVALSGWMHNGELMCLSKPGKKMCLPPFRPAETLINLADHLCQCAGLMELAKR